MKIILLLSLFISLSAWGKTYEFDPNYVVINDRSDQPDYCSMSFDGSLLDLTLERKTFTYTIYFQGSPASRLVFKSAAECQSSILETKKLIKEARNKHALLKLKKDSEDLPTVTSSKIKGPAPKIKTAEECRYLRIFEKSLNCENKKIYTAQVECKDELGLQVSASVLCEGKKPLSAKECFNSKIAGKEIDPDTAEIHYSTPKKSGVR